MMYLNGSPVAQDFVNAGRYLRKGCDLKDAEGCIEFSSMYRKGGGVQESGDMAGYYVLKAKEICE